MLDTVEKMVLTYVQLNDRESLEDLRTYREKLVVHLKTRTGVAFSLLIHQIDAEIAVIKAGLDRLNAVAMHSEPFARPTIRTTHPEPEPVPPGVDGGIESIGTPLADAK